MNLNTIRVATYTRINQPDKTRSLMVQQEELHGYIKRQTGWMLACQFTDQGSGRIAGLPGVKDMLRHAQSGGFDLLLVCRLDRLSRSFAHLDKVLTELKRAGVRVCTVDESFDSEKLSEGALLAALGGEHDRVNLL